MKRVAILKHSETAPNFEFRELASQTTFGSIKLNNLPKFFKIVSI